MSFRIPKIRRAFRFQMPMARQVNALADIVNRGIIIPTPGVMPERLQDGRIRLFGFAQGPVGVAVASPPTPSPGLPGGVFTNFYAQSGGSNLNSGSDNNNAAKYTSTNGNWNGSTIFTPTDGSNPVANGVAVGDFVSVYLDAATEGVFIARITAVTNAANGAITVSTTAKAGIAPSSSATGRSLKCGGAFRGMNGASQFPFSLAGLGALVNASSDWCRFNFKNDVTYTCSAQINQVFPSGGVVQGYASTLGDGGKAIFSSSFASGLSGYYQFIVASGGLGTTFIDIIWDSTATSGIAGLVDCANTGSAFLRNLFRNSRGFGVGLANRSILFECEITGNCKNNNASEGAILITGPGCLLAFCDVHDNNFTGSLNNAAGVLLKTGDMAYLLHCLIRKNGGSGLSCASSSQAAGIVSWGCDYYGNSGDAITISQNAAQGFSIIANNNFLKNSGRGVNNSSSALGILWNNGYGNGSMANGNPNALGRLIEVAGVTYGAGATPWVNAEGGDFTSAGLADAKNGGRGAFGGGITVGYPDIGAAQHFG